MTNEEFIFNFLGRGVVNRAERVTEPWTPEDEQRYMILRDALQKACDALEHHLHGAALFMLADVLHGREWAVRLFVREIEDDIPF